MEKVGKSIAPTLTTGRYKNITFLEPIREPRLQNNQPAWNLRETGVSKDTRQEHLPEQTQVPYKPVRRVQQRFSCVVKGQV